MAIVSTTEHLALKQGLMQVVGLGTGIAAGAGQVDTVTIAAAEANVAYTMSLDEQDIDGNVLNTYTVIYTATATPTIAEIRDGLIALAKANSSFASVATAAVGAADEIVLTAVLLGDPLFLTVSDDGSGTAITEVETTARVNGKILWLENDNERIENVIDGDAFAKLMPTSDGLASGIDETKYEYDSGTDKQERRIEGERIMHVSVDIYTRNAVSARTKDANDLARDLTAIIANPAAIELMNAAKGVIRDHSAVRKLTSLLGPGWEARAGIDFVVSYVVGTLETDTGFITAIDPITEADGSLIVRT